MDEKLVTRITMGNKRKIRVSSGIQTRDGHRGQKSSVYYVSIIWPDGRQKEEIVTYGVYCRWIEGLTADIIYTCSNIPGGELIHINTVNIVYLNNEIPTNAVSHYVQKTADMLKEIQKVPTKQEHQPLDKGFKKGIVYIILVAAAVIFAIAFGDINENPGRDVLFKQDTIMKIIGIVVGLIIIIAAIVVMGKAPKKSESATKGWKFEVVNVGPIGNGVGQELFLCSLNNDGWTEGYPYLRYVTKGNVSYAKGDIVVITLSKIVKLDINASNPNLWYFDISYLGDGDVAKSKTGRMIIKL